MQKFMKIIIIDDISKKVVKLNRGSWERISLFEIANNGIYFDNNNNNIFPIQ